MIRLLKEKERDLVLRFLESEPSLNLFLIGDIYNNGMHTDFQELWGDFNELGELRAVLLRFYDSYIPYAPGDFDVEGLAAVISDQGIIQMLSGMDSVTKAFRPVLPLNWSKIRQTYFAELVGSGKLEASSRKISLEVKKMTVKDVPKIMTLTRDIQEFDISTNTEKMLTQSLQSGDSRGWWVASGDKAVAMVRTTAENPYSAMIVGVGTHQTYRGQGLASHLLNILCQELLDEGKRLCLFYDNPEAGTIYKRLGFRDIGMWNMIRN